MSPTRQTLSDPATANPGGNLGAESERLRQADDNGVPWRGWGP
jgi:hypothetical protein